MNLDLNCLSLMELLELRDGADDQAARDHLNICARCRTLLSALPAELDLTGLAVPPGGAPHAAVARQAAPAEIRTGSLWRAVPDTGSDFAWVVAVIGRSPEADDRLMVAPVAGRSALATDSDLVLDPAVLGYDAFVDLGNLGTLLRCQLFEPVTRLDRSLAQALAALHRHVLTGAPAPAAAPRGLPVLDEVDPRLLEQAARGDALRTLWRPALMLVDADPEEDADDADDADAAQLVNAPGSTAKQPALGEVLAGHLEGPQAEWDRASLLEQSGIDGAHLTSFLSDHLDLTDKTDAPALARVIYVLQVPWTQAEAAVAATLASSTGGSRSAEGPTLPMAARSRADADPQDTTRDLYADQSSVDESAQARAREVAAYLAELRHELDDLE